MPTLVLTVLCESCQKQVDGDLIGEYRGRVICDDCASKLQPERYNATRFEIVVEGEKMCLAKTGSTMANCGVAAVEDDLGDVVFFSERFANLFGEPVLGQATKDYLPEEIRLLHWGTHRKTVRGGHAEEYSFTMSGEQWTGECFPFRVAGETFSLSIFGKACGLTL